MENKPKVKKAITPEIKIIKTFYKFFSGIIKAQCPYCKTDDACHIASGEINKKGTLLIDCPYCNEDLIITWEVK